VAVGFPGCEPLHGVVLVKGFVCAVYPAETEGFFNGIVVLNTFQADRFFGINQPDFAADVEILQKPISPLGSCFDIQNTLRFHSVPFNPNQEL